MHHCTKMCVQKILTKIMNVYKLLVLISKEEEIPYPNPPPLIITITANAMNLSRPTYYKPYLFT
jgi:hypothetical protein